MKKLIALLTLLGLCFSLFACGNKGDNGNDVPNGDTSNNTEENISKTPCEDALKSLASVSVFENDWLIYYWTTNNLDKFKNPASVKLTDKAFYHEDASGEVDYFVVGYRAENSFGGTTVSYMKLTLYSLTATDWEPMIPMNDFYGDTVYSYYISSQTKDALAEYISQHY